MGVGVGGCRRSKGERESRPVLFERDAVQERIAPTFNFLIIPGLLPHPQVIEYLEHKHGPPLNWNHSLKMWPLKMDENVKAAAPATAGPKPTPKPRPQSRAKVSTSVERTFSAVLQETSASQALGFRGAVKCLLRISDISIKLIDSDTHGEVAAWPLVAIAE